MLLRLRLGVRYIEKSLAKDIKKTMYNSVRVLPKSVSYKSSFLKPESPTAFHMLQKRIVRIRNSLQKRKYSSLLVKVSGSGGVISTYPQSNTVHTILRSRTCEKLANSQHNNKPNLLCMTPNRLMYRYQC